MYDTDVLKSVYRRILSGLDRDMKKSERRLERQERRLDREFRRKLRSQSLPSPPAVREQDPSAYKKLGFFFATLAVCVGALL